MRFLIQRVKESCVQVEKETIGRIDSGLLVFIGISESDTKEIADKMIDKLLKLRIFEDEEGKTNRSLVQVNGKLLLISQFTLYANCKKGNRPSFINAGNPIMSEELYEYIIKKAKQSLTDSFVEKGKFGAEMQVTIVNDGPFTIWLDSDDIIR